MTLTVRELIVPKNFTCRNVITTPAMLPFRFSYLLPFARKLKSLLLLGKAERGQVVDLQSQSVKSTACSSGYGWLVGAATTQSTFSRECGGPLSPCHCCTGRCRKDRSRCAAPVSPALTHRYIQTSMS